MQSDPWSFPLITIISKVNSRTYSSFFDHIFYFCNKVRDQGMAASDGKQWKPFLITSPHDMKSHQIFLGRGGAAKGPGVIHFCHLCMFTSNEIALSNQVQCVKCKCKGNTFCLHHDICCAEEIAKRREELEAL
jgi:hypothetical protein